MTKKIFGMAAMSAIVFSMFACSGDEGANGINGKDGADGRDGVSCSVKALKDSSGFKVLCDGDSVGVIKNGSDGENGANGKDGKNGKNGTDGKDGEDGSTPTAKAGKNGSDGTDCTAKATKDKDGFYIICGKDTVGTLTNGKAGKAAKASNGESCELEDEGDGSVKITCGETSATLFKAMCGKESFDPATQFCFDQGSLNAVVGKRCKYRAGSTEDFFDQVYNPLNSFCDDNDTLRTLCDVDKDGDGEPPYEMVAYDFEKEYCDSENHKVMAYIACAPGSDVKRKATQYCYTTKGVEGIQVEDMVTCGTGVGAGLINPRTQFCKVTAGSSNPGKRLICGDAAAQKDTLNIDIRYNEVADNAGNGEICDDRDYQVYKYVKIGSLTWMAQNLNYAYNKPTAGNGLDSSSVCYGDKGDVEPIDRGDCGNGKGRLYIWSAAIDSAALDAAGSVCGDGMQCNFTEDVQGVCPDGWHLPSKADIDALVSYDGNTVTTISIKLKAQETWTTPGTDDYGFSALNAGYRSVEKEFKNTCTFFWTSENNTTDKAYGLFLHATDIYSNPGSDKKSLMGSVRCVKD